MSDPIVEMFLPKGPREWINANGRKHWRARSKSTKEWRFLAAWAAKGMGLRQITGKTRVICELQFADNRRRDPANWAPTAKAVIDGLVDAGVFVDDNHKHITGPDMRIAEPAKRAAIGIRVLIYPEES